MKFTQYNLEDILIYANGQPFLEEVKSLTKKVFILKNQLKEWYSEGDPSIFELADKNLSALVLKKLDAIEVKNVEFLNLSYRELMDQKQHDLDMLISLISNLLTLHYHALEWLKYLSNKYLPLDEDDEKEVHIEWE